MNSKPPHKVKETFDRPMRLCIAHNGIIYTRRGDGHWYRIGSISSKGKASPIMQRVLSNCSSDHPELDFRKVL